MSAEQRETLDAILRQSAFPADSDVNEQRRQLRELLSAQPLPADITVTAAALGGVPTAEITVDGIEPRHSVLYFHGGVYVMGDAFLAADLASQVARRTRAKAISVDYRLAPEHPYPAAVDDALAAYEALLNNGTAPSVIVFAGESAGGGDGVAQDVHAAVEVQDNVARFDSVERDLGGWDAAQCGCGHGHIGGQRLRRYRCRRGRLTAAGLLRGSLAVRRSRRISIPAGWRALPGLPPGRLGRVTGSW